MIPAMSRTATIPSQIYQVLGWLLGQLSLSGRLASSVSSLLLRLVMRMGLFVVLAATAAEKKEDLLRVARTHLSSFLGRPLIVKHPNHG
jgi:hypothetical protein